MKIAQPELDASCIICNRNQIRLIQLKQYSTFYCADCLRSGLTLLDPEGEQERDALRAQCAALQAEIEVSNQLLAGRDQLLEAIPQCPVHGPCIPHALEWIERAVARQDQRDEAHDAAQNLAGALNVAWEQIETMVAAFDDIRRNHISYQYDQDMAVKIHAVCNQMVAQFSTPPADDAQVVASRRDEQDEEICFWCAKPITPAESGHQLQTGDWEHIGECPG